MEKFGYEAMDASKLQGFIWEGGVRRVTLEDRVELRLPWHFGKMADETSEPLCLTFRKLDEPHDSALMRRIRQLGTTIDSEKYDYFEISDGGRALKELARKVGDVTPYLGKIRYLMRHLGEFEWKGGRILRIRYYAYSPYRHTDVLNQMLELITLVTNLDCLPYTADEVEKKEGEQDEV